MELVGLLSKQILMTDPSAGPSQLEQHPGGANLALCKSRNSNLCLQDPGSFPSPVSGSEVQGVGLG